MVPARATSRRLTHAAALERLGPWSGRAAVGTAALAVGWLIGHGRATLPVAASVGIVVLVRLSAEPRRGLLWGVLIVLLIPATTTVGGGKLSVIRVAALLVALAVAFDLRRPATVGRLSAVDWCVAGFCVVGIVGWLLEAQPPHGSAFAINYVLPLAFYVGARRFGADVDQVINVIFVGASLASLTVLYEALVVHRPLFADPTSYYWSATSAFIFRPGGVFGGPPQAASVLAMSTLCGLPLVYRAHGMKRIGLSACLIASFAALVLTFTRGPLLGFALGLVAFAVLLGPATWARFAYAGGTLGVFAAVALLPHIQTTAWFEKGVLRGGTLAARQVVWNQTRALITDSTSHELFGHGTNSVVIGTPWLPGDPPADIAQVPALTQAGAQDQYIRTLIEGGATGLLLLVGWILGAVANGVALSFRRARDRRTAAALTAACVAFAVTALVDDALRQSQTEVMLALVTGLLVSLSRGDADAGESRL